SRPLVDIRLEALATRGGVPPGLLGISVHVRYGEFFTFLGPPHSGKTDVLRAVAGFMTPSAGRVVVDGEDILALPPGARSIGYVFQEGALWRHMSVREHVAFGLQLHGGQVAQLGEPSEVYQHPRTRVVAEALGPANFLPVRVVEVRDLGVVVETEGGHQVPVAGVGEYREGSRGLLVLRPELLSMTD